MSAIKEPVGGRRRDVLRVLKAAGAPMSIVAIAGELDVHPNTVRFHLDSLLGDGQVEQVMAERKGPGRPALMFRATRQMDRGGPRRYRLLAEILAIGLTADGDAAGKALAAGRAWGQQLAPRGRARESVDHLVDVLDELGFAPERRGRTQIGLRHCPFLELAEARESVVCPIHLGLMQGALENWSAPVTVKRLDAFAEPDLCMAHLGVAR
ncbi:helix-turn-helix transcriptional regulator [Mycobacterium branderi]|uniref:Transcriptional regulator n=1 Tax=Mycobacterium branderi TaxID=43348 RepID=A0A7I7WB60_9MYCO|nr:helix-turn-helix domain-containing protein [Mycobacterium branderi]MCV7232220.1 transcriptional regulator [Mycobacterium branderi]ORA33779.1 transcriptional regulator [Mycobacterium branderi]BBZ14237.1 transcriptional regulator [Mycobacterium branderi]